MVRECTKERVVRNMGPTTSRTWTSVGSTTTSVATVAARTRSEVLCASAPADTRSLLTVETAR